MWFDLDKVVVSTWPSWDSANTTRTAKNITSESSTTSSPSTFAPSGTSSDKAQQDLRYVELPHLGSCLPAHTTKAVPPISAISA